MSTISLIFYDLFANGFTDINIGSYEVSVKKVGDNLYEIIGTDIFIKTSMCYEYAYHDDAILVYEYKYGYTKGKLIFL